MGFVQQERGEVRREDGRVDDQQQDDPVPDRLERAVVQYRPFVDLGRLELVLGQYVRAQRQHLREQQQRRLTRREDRPVSRARRAIASERNRAGQHRPTVVYRTVPQ